jgi:hypothetical protein
MKKFDLESAKEGATVVDARGYSVRILCTDAQVGNYYARGTVVGLVRLGLSDEVAYYTSQGEALGYPNGERDLYMEPVTREKWVNIYPYTAPAVAPPSARFLYDTEDDAAMGSCGGGIQVKVIWLEE